MNQLQVAFCQMTSTDSWQQNLDQIAQCLSNLKSPSDLLVLPENAHFFKVGENSPKDPFPLQHPVFQGLKNLSQQFDIDILTVGSVFVEGRTYCGITLVTATTEPEVIYKKIHLFDVDVKGEKPVRESDQYAAGSSPVVWNYKAWKFGMSVCYDLRFSELYSYYAKQAVDIILAPSSFLRPTGKAHWHILNRARAIESQCYVLSPAQFGEHKSSLGGDKIRKTFGHSLLISPWGEVIEDLDQKGPICVSYSLDKSQIEQVRKQIPMSKHRKLEPFKI